MDNSRIESHRDDSDHQSLLDITGEYSDNDSVILWKAQSDVKPGIYDDNGCVFSRVSSSMSSGSSYPPTCRSDRADALQRAEETKIRNGIRIKHGDLEGVRTFSGSDLTTED